MTKAVCDRLNSLGFYVVVNEIQGTADLFSDSVVALLNKPYKPTSKLKCVGTISYAQASVDYDALQQLVNP